jgi:hypothetical protein
MTNKRELRVLTASFIQEYTTNPDEILMSFDSWIVTIYGIECTKEYYDIEYFDLGMNDDWVSHLRDKVWVTEKIIDDFNLAFNFAKKVKRAIEEY